MKFIINQEGFVSVGGGTIYTIAAFTKSWRLVYDNY